MIHFGLSNKTLKTQILSNCFNDIPLFFQINYRILERKGVTNILITDLTNIQQQFCRDNHVQMWNFIKNLELTGHQVRWMVDTDERICGVFFMHQHGIEETRKLSECIVVDATYKTNSHKMVLLNFVVAGTLRSREKPKQLTTIPIAGC